jgi:hypothetical protein
MVLRHVKRIGLKILLHNEPALAFFTDDGAAVYRTLRYRLAYPANPQAFALAKGEERKPLMPANLNAIRGADGPG